MGANLEEGGRVKEVLARELKLMSVNHTGGAYANIGVQLAPVEAQAGMHEGVGHVEDGALHNCAVGAGSE